MGQQEVLNWLKGKGWVTSEEILKHMKVGSRSMNYSLMSLVNHNEIKKKKDKNRKNGYLYKV